jgi:hypothetical protein
MRTILGRFGLAVSVLAASLSFVATSPANAATVCPLGTYVSNYDASICISTPPGTFTNAVGATEPIPCDPGTYQPYYRQTSCRNTPPGTATVSAGSEVPNNCSPGTFANNEGSIICLSAPSGMYIPDSGASAAIPCPATPLNAASRATTGNKKVIDCFSFSGNSLVLPNGNSTVDNEIGFEFFVNTGIASGDNVRITFTDTVLPDPTRVYQIVAQANLPDSDPKRGTITVPLAWQNTSYFRGCSTSCVSGAPISSLPLSVYNIKVEVKDNSTPSAWVDLGTAGAVQVTDTITTKPQMYLQAWPYFTDSATVGIGLPENRMPDSAIIKISDAPEYLNPTIVKTYTLGPGSLTDYIDLRFSGTQTSPHVVAASNEVIAPGQWWVSVSYQDESKNPVASDEWLWPMLVTRSCEPGTFSVDGMQECIPVPAGRWITYPSPEAFNNVTRLFEPSQCDAGSYQPSPGGTACLLADPGYFVSQTGSISQTTCPAGTYQPLAGSSSCLLVPEVVTNSAPVNPNTNCAVKKGANASAKCLLKGAGVSLPAKSKIKIKMNKKFKKICKVKGSKVKALKVGTCTVTVSVKPKKGKTVKYTVNMIVR